MPDRDDHEPERKKKPEGEHRPERPTRERPNFPNFNPEIPGDDNLPAAPSDQPRRPNPEPEGPASSPDLDRASGDETRRATSGSQINNPSMRDMLNRLNRIDQEGDISDEEARRLAGLDHEGDEPRPQEPNIVPAVTRHEVARMSQDIQAAGQVYPKWHNIKHLPGFLNRQIRGMGGDLFRMFTTTPHHDILTISTKANSEREIKAVLGWLKQNGEELPEVDIDFSGYNMIDPMGRPYKPEVREYRTQNTRFHIVHDNEGWYIYAYPEGTAVEHKNKQEIEYSRKNNDEDEDDGLDLYGAPIKKLKEETHMKFSSLSEELRHLTSKLDKLQESEVDLDLEINIILDEATDIALNEASTLQGLIGKYPGGMELVRALHKRHELAAGKKTLKAGRKGAEYQQLSRPGSQNIDPQYEPIVGAKNVSQLIKASRDNFMILVGDSGCAAVKVDSKDYLAREKAYKAKHGAGAEYSSSTDNQLQWRVLWSTGGGVDEEVAKYRMGRTDRTGGQEGTTGTPNLLNVLGDRIGFVGYPKMIFRATGAVERDLRATRASYKDSGETAKVTDEQVAMKIKPIIQKMVQNAIGQIMAKASRLSQAGNFSKATEFAQSGEKLQALMTAMDTSNPDYTYTGRDRWNRGPMGTYFAAVEKAIDTMTQGKDATEANQIRAAIVQGNVESLGQFLNHVRDNLLRAGTLR